MRKTVVMTAALGVIAAGATVPAASGAEPAPAASGPPVIVGLGDSFMSGEGVVYANHNYQGDTTKTGDATWNTASGTLILAGTFLQVFGDANGFPNTGGKESVPYCDRSYAAPMNIGGGWTAKNYACSGAVVDTEVVEKKTGAVGSAIKVLKIGIDDYDVANPIGNATQLPRGIGQALLLKQYGQQDPKPNIKVVALSIGGNDFGFSDIAKQCITDQSLNKRCEDDKTIFVRVQQGLADAQTAVTTAIKRVTKNMADAGYDPEDWKLVYQNPPMPVPTSENMKFADEGGLTSPRPSQGGCGLFNSTLDWLNGTVYPDLVKALTAGVQDARSALGKTQVTVLDTTETFNGHKLCEKGTLGKLNYKTGQVGKNPVWQEDNGQNTEWVTFVSRTEQFTGNIYQQQMPVHPNYWGQRALSGCLNLAKDTEGAIVIACKQDGDGWDALQQRPNMKLTDQRVLWVTAAGQPVISGSPNVGQTLTADTDGVFEPEGAAFEYTYQWLRDGNPIAGATAKTYVPNPGDVATDISVKVTASLPETGPDTATSLPVSVSDIAVLTMPSITGPTKVGGTLTLDPGTYNPAPSSVTQKWVANGEVIEGQTGTTLVLTPDLVDKHITAEITVEAAGFTPLTWFAPETAAVEKGQATATGKPAITGTPKGGETLTADISGVTFSQTPDVVTYKWMRDGEVIPGSTAQTHEITDADADKKLTVIATGHAAGYTDAVSETSDPTTPVSKGKMQVLKDPKLKYWNSLIQGTKPIKPKGARLGLPIRVDISNVFSEFEVETKVKWHRVKDGKNSVIKGVTGLDYTPKVKDKGAKIYATVTTTDAAFEPVTATSNKVKVIKGKPVMVYQPQILKTSVKAGKTLKARKAVFQPNQAATYQWLRGKKVIKGATGLKYKTTKQDKGKKIKVRAVTKASKNYLSSAPANSNAVKVK